MMGMLLLPLLLVMMMMMKPIKISHSIKVTHELCTEYSYNRLLKRIRITKRIPERELVYCAYSFHATCCCCNNVAKDIDSDKTAIAIVHV